MERIGSLSGCRWMAPKSGFDFPHFLHAGSSFSLATSSSLPEFVRCIGNHDLFKLPDLRAHVFKTPLKQFNKHFKFLGYLFPEFLRGWADPLQVYKKVLKRKRCALRSLEEKEGRWFLS